MPEDNIKKDKNLKRQCDKVKIWFDKLLDKFITKPIVEPRYSRANSFSVGRRRSSTAEVLSERNSLVGTAAAPGTSLTKANNESVELSSEEKCITIRDHPMRYHHRVSNVPDQISIAEDQMLETIMNKVGEEPSIPADLMSKSDKKRLVRKLSTQFSNNPLQIEDNNALDFNDRESMMQFVVSNLSSTCGLAGTAGKMENTANAMPCRASVNSLGVSGIGRISTYSNPRASTGGLVARRSTVKAQNLEPREIASESEDTIFKDYLEDLENRPLTDQELEQLENTTAMREAKRLEKFRKASLASQNQRLSVVRNSLLIEKESSGHSGINVESSHYSSGLESNLLSNSCSKCSIPVTVCRSKSLKSKTSNKSLRSKTNLKKAELNNLFIDMGPIPEGDMSRLVDSNAPSFVLSEAALEQGQNQPEETDRDENSLESTSIRYLDSKLTDPKSCTSLEMYTQQAEERFNMISEHAINNKNLTTVSGLSQYPLPGSKKTPLGVGGVYNTTRSAKNTMSAQEFINEAIGGSKTVEKRTSVQAESNRKSAALKK